MEEKKASGGYQLLLVVLLLVIVMGVVGYKFLYEPMAKEKKAILDENYELEVRFRTLKNMLRDEEQFKDAIAVSRTLINSEMKKYSAGNTPEKSIMLIDQMEKEIELEIPNVSFTAPVVITSVEMPRINEIEGGSYTIDYYNIELLGEQVIFSFICTYDQLKKVNDFITTNTERMNVGAMNVAFDSDSGKLAGSYTLNIYTAKGGDGTYIAPEILDLRLGTENIFGD